MPADGPVVEMADMIKIDFSATDPAARHDLARRQAPGPGLALDGLPARLYLDSGFFVKYPAPCCNLMVK